MKNNINAERIENLITRFHNLPQADSERLIELLKAETKNFSGEAKQWLVDFIEVLNELV